MQPTTSFAAFLATTLAMTDMVAAIPPRMTIPTNGATFSINQVRNVKHKEKHGTLALEKAYLKFNAAMPDDVSTAVTRIRQSFASLTSGLLSGSRKGLSGKRATGSAVTTPEDYDVEYLTPVQIGTPPQTLNLDIDTGSSDLWVYSTATPASDVNGQEVYDPDASTTSVLQSGQSWDISYGDGSSSKGTVYLDVVSIGGMTVQSQAVEAATDVSSEFTADTEIDGLLGLAFSSLNTVSPTQQKTFFDNAKDSLDKFLFTADLKAAAPGTYNFGFIDETAYTGSLSYTPVDTTDGFWMFTTTGYSIGNGTFSSTKISGIADTGTTLLLLPTAVVTAYYAQVAGSSYDSTNGGYVFPCTLTPPDFSFGVGDNTITIPGDYINYAPIDTASTSCYGGIQDNSGLGFSIFGDVALKAAFVVFNGADNTLGWASKTL